ncbi:26S protease regulatory subunit 4 [Lecanosticta acicola]|uniref:26S protease regulatory subunit 4 n=1 Tax=Lecanosticta acicola TaxID=111012 RepID=A0AAI8YXY2_9PEZI|nr:26S protease regulatory subunit 4 [Lecanosticta acicola]
MASLLGTHCRLFYRTLHRDSPYFRAQLGTYNERKRLEERHVHFNITALLEAAAASINRQKSDVKSFRKLAEGGFNRVFEITMRDGLQIVARLPYSSTQPKSLATASEVATMDLVRIHGVPVPVVYGYSADDNNPVGAEYIFMEKVAGQCLGEIWFDLSDRERLKLLGAIVDQEAKMFDIAFPAYGSIYYTSDVPEDVSLKHWFGNRSQLAIQRGPSTSAYEVLAAAANKEISWVQSYSRPRFPFDREYREMFDYKKVDPCEHARNLQAFLDIAPHIVPRQEWLHRHVIRHPDLNPNNIFVDDNFNISGIIDWQHSVVLPLFLHAGIPASLQNYGDPESEELKKPEYPTNLNELDEDDRRKDLELYRRRHTHFYYIGATITKLNTHYKALSHDKGLLRKKLYQHAAEPWEGNPIPLKADLVQIATGWSEFANADANDAGNDNHNMPTCPIAFDAGEVDATMNKMLEQEDMDGKMRILREVIGISNDGWVQFERYHDAVAEAAEMKKQALGFAESDLERETTERHWVFDDFDEEE